MSAVWQKSVCRVCYRLPGAERFTVLFSSQAPDILTSSDDLHERSGFLIAPFTPTADSPVVMVRPDCVEHHPLEEAQAPLSLHDMADVPDIPENYRRNFNAFHSAVADGRFDKLVLSACLTRPCSLDEARIKALFRAACLAYPDFMVALFSTPLTGTWLVASPEMLLDGSDDRWHTMALAGTIPLGTNQWSAKNRREQQLVECFVRTTLEDHVEHITAQGPKSRQAGHLQHLCTAFDFSMKRERLGALIRALHPTPAVSGLERDRAMDFILSHEGHARRYYSGFCGPTDPHEGTRLYVSLRCAAIDAEQGEVTLWAGGGIMPDSRLEEEWAEAVEKMHTAGRLIDYVQ